MAPRPGHRRRQRAKRLTAAGMSVAVALASGPATTLIARADSSLASKAAPSPAPIPQSSGPAIALTGPPAVSPPSTKARSGRSPVPVGRHHGKHAYSPVLFGADDLNYDEQLGIVIARGNVEITEDNRTLMADAVSYNQRTDTITASGHVTLIRETGDIIFGDYLELTDQMKEGFIKDVRMLLADRSRIAGNTARRTAGNRLEIRRGVYSPCDLCSEDPTRAPVWQLRAGTLIHNQEQKLIEYRDVSLELFGIPVLYSPYLSHPDPSVKRQSGLLAPNFGSSSTLGVHATIPYYWVTGPDSDLTISPIITSDAGAVLAGEYRQHFAYGQLDVSGSIAGGSQTYDSNEALSGTNQIRGHIFANGVFDLDQQFRTGFNIARSTDQTYLRVYNFSQTNSYLPSNVYLEDFDGRNYGSINAWAFQPLIQGQSSRTQPFVLPIVDYNWNSRPTSWGGRFTTNADASDIFRQSGSSSRRLSVGTEFDYPFKIPGGQLFNAIAAVRGDSYDVSNVPVHGNNYDGTAARVFPQVGLEWHYPFVRYGSSTFIVEPIAAIYAAPNHLNPSRIPNDDSVAFEFSDQDLFTRNRLTGYDQVDQGQRIDYAIHGSWLGSGGHRIDGLFGESYRFEKGSIFEDGTGLNTQRSDYVGRLRFSPSSLLDVVYRFRYNQDDFTPERQEVGTTINLPRTHLGLNYTYLAPVVRNEQPQIQQVNAFISVKLDDYWTAAVGGVHSLTGGTADLSNVASVQYADECLTFQLSLTQTGTQDRDLRAGTSVLFSFVFKNLGEIGLPSLHPFPGQS